MEKIESTKVSKVYFQFESNNFSSFDDDDDEVPILLNLERYWTFSFVFWLDHANELLKEIKYAVIMKDKEMKKIGNVCDRNKTWIEEKESLKLRLESLEFDRE